MKIYKYPYRLCLVTTFILGWTQISYSNKTFKADEVGRKNVGIGASFIPSTLSFETFNENLPERRLHSWKLLEQVTQKTEKGHPVFLTWYESEEISSIFKLALKKFGPANKDQSGFSKEQAEEALKEYSSQKRSSLSLRAKNEDGIFHNDMAGNLFNNPMVIHYLMFYNEMLNCNTKSIENLWQLKKDGEVESFSPCMKKEFPKDSVMIKARWTPAQFTEYLTAYDTSESSIKKFLGPNPTSDEIEGESVKIGDYKPYSYTTRNGALWYLSALHVVTKEVDEWVWASYWWSNTPTKDLGEDKISFTDSSLQNYKMCVATHFEEKNTSDLSEFDDMPTLKKAILASLDQNNRLEGASWCANPYIEGTFPRTNCIGCHQYAGTDISFEIETDRKKGNFPADFTFAYDNIVRRIRSDLKDHSK